MLFREHYSLPRACVCAPLVRLSSSNLVYNTALPSYTPRGRGRRFLARAEAGSPLCLKSRFATQVVVLSSADVRFKHRRGYFLRRPRRSTATHGAGTSILAALPSVHPLLPRMDISWSGGITRSCSGLLAGSHWSHLRHRERPACRLDHEDALGTTAARMRHCHHTSSSADISPFAEKGPLSSMAVESVIGWN